MSSKRLLLIGVPLVAAILVGRALLVSAPSTPTHLLNDVRTRVGEGSFDQRRALRDLDRAHLGAEAEGDQVLVANVLSLKAEILRGLGSLAEAQVVLEELLNEHVPDNPRIDLRLAEVLAAQGEPEAALDRVAALIDREPEFAPAWRLAGLLQTQRAKVYRDEAVAIARGVLMGSEASEAVRHVEALAARAPSDPERSAHAAALNALLAERDPVSLEAIYDKVYPASDDNALARACLARGCTGDVDGKTVALLMDLCTGAGQAPLAADLGVAARYVPRLTEDHDLASSLLRALVETGREAEIVSMLGAWNWGEDLASLEFHEAACLALYQIRDAQQLLRAQRPLIDLGGRDGASKATFYQAMSMLWRGNFSEDEVLERFERYLAGDEPAQPVPDAIALAYQGLAECNRELGRVRGEREALVGVTQATENVPGEVWMRLVELSLSLPNISYTVAEERWTLALAAMPERTAELEPRWYELGELALEEEGYDLDTVLRRMQTQRQPVPNMPVGPATRVRVAQSHLENGESRFAIRGARELLDEFPTLLPALDVLIEGLLRTGAEREAVGALLERLTLAGRDARSLEFLRRVGEDSFSPQQRLTAMLADPALTGRMTMARHALATGHPDRALQALLGTPTSEGRSSPEVTLLIGRAFLEDGRHETAAERLSELREDPDLGDEAMVLEIEARVLGGQSDAEQVLALAEALAARPELAVEQALTAADRLLASPWPMAAAVLLERLDSQPETRSGELFLRQAVLTTYTVDPTAAVESLERADPYLADGRARLGHILLAVDARSWSALPELVSDLREGGFEPTLFEEAVLSIFEERLDAALQLAEAELARPETPLHESVDWALVASAARLLAGEEPELPPYFGPQARGETAALLRGVGEVPRDPREVLGPLLALRRGTWRTWGAQRLQEIDLKIAPLWSLYLGADARSILGDATTARRSLELVNRRFPAFGPGWDAMELLIRELGYGEAGITRLRVQRLDAIGPELAGAPLAVAVDRAAGLALDEKLPQARKALRDALQEAEQAAAAAGEPAPVLGRDLLARLEIQLGDAEAGLSEYLRACEGLPSISDSYLVGEVLAWLEVAARSRAISDESLRLALARLSERFPSDPLVPLTASRIEVEASPSPAVVTRAMRRLVGFRDRTSHTPIDSLREGSARAFVDFLMPIAPQEAHALVAADLQREPGDLDLWLLEAETLTARGLGKEALERLETLVEMSSAPEAHRGLAQALARRGTDVREIETHLDIADADAERVDARSLYIRQVAILSGSRNVPPATIDHLMNLWRRRGELERDIPIPELGRTYARALLTRRMPADLRRLEEVIEVLIDANPEGYLRDVLRAMAGLATQMGRASSRGNVPQDVEAELERLDEGEGGPKRQQREADREAVRQRRLEENRKKAGELREQSGEPSTRPSGKQSERRRRPAAARRDADGAAAETTRGADRAPAARRQRPAPDEGDDAGEAGKPTTESAPRDDLPAPRRERKPPTENG